MASAATNRSLLGVYGIAIASAIGAALSLYNDLVPGTGIDHTYGALLVVISSTLILTASLVLVFLSPAPRWIREILSVLLLIGIIGTGCAAYFLESYGLLGLMVLAFIGWSVRALSGLKEAGPSRGQFVHG